MQIRPITDIEFAFAPEPRSWFSIHATIDGDGFVVTADDTMELNTIYNMHVWLRTLISPDSREEPIFSCIQTWDRRRPHWLMDDEEVVFTWLASDITDSDFQLVVQDSGQGDPPQDLFWRGRVDKRAFVAAFYTGYRAFTDDLSIRQAIREAEADLARKEAALPPDWRTRQWLATMGDPLWQQLNICNRIRRVIESHQRRDLNDRRNLAIEAWLAANG